MTRTDVPDHFLSMRPTRRLPPTVVTYMGRGYARLTHIDEETGIEYVSEVNFPRNGLYTMLAPTCRLVSIEMPEPYPEFRSAAGDICIAMEQPSWAVAVYSRNGVYKLSVDSIYFDSNGDPT